MKLLLFPLSLVIALAFSIFWIQPEISSVFSLRLEKEDAEKRLVRTEEVISNIDALDRSLNENMGNEQFIKTYLPQSGSDDRILDEMNFFAGESGLLLASAKLERVSSEVALAAEQAAKAAAEQEEIRSASPGSLLNTGTSSVSDAYVSSSPAARVRSANVSLSVFGKYEQIKAFIDRVYRADHFQRFLSVEVKSATQNGPTSAPIAPDTLTASLKVQFSFLSKTTVAKGTFLEAFKKPNFDLSVVQDLRDRATNTVPSLEAVPSARQNPFVR